MIDVSVLLTFQPSALILVSEEHVSVLTPVNAIRVGPEVFVRRV
jgi:hypothetical protein